MKIALITICALYVRQAGENPQKDKEVCQLSILSYKKFCTLNLVLSVELVSLKMEAVCICIAVVVELSSVGYAIK